MRFWIRELVGYVLIVLGLLGFYFALALFGSDRIIAGTEFMVPSIFVFRGGIHLLKVAMAARICLYAQPQLRRQQRRLARTEKPSKPDPGLDW